MSIKYTIDSKNRKCAIFNNMKFIQEKEKGYYRIDTNWHKDIKNSYRLHQAVYEYYKGEIPKGYHVHHKDHNKENNDISNLELMTNSEHQKLHFAQMSNEEKKEKLGKFMSAGIKAATEWHKTNPMSKQIHSESAKKGWQNKESKEHTCIHCGEKFYTKTNECKFCSQKCKNDYKLGYSLIDIESIEPIGKQDVYNMEVEKYHNYSINGGLIVHNCDAMRYYIYTIVPSWRHGVRKGE